MTDARGVATALRVLTFLTLALCVHRTFAAEPGPELKRTGPRIVFLGDSITAAGHFVNDIETALFIRQNGTSVPEIIGLGLSSETASGLSEPDHPFPRPWIHERLGRVLEATRPDVLIACYGMNDGIYHPFSSKRFSAYREGIQSLVKNGREAGARVVLLTPPPYAGEAVPLPAPVEGQQFGYLHPDPNYDEVLARFSQWIMTLEQQDGVSAIDVRTAMLEHLNEAYERDPIHPNVLGHRVLARTILSQWSKVDPDTPDDGLTMPVDDPRWERVSGLVAERRSTHDGALLWEIGHNRPGKPPETTMSEARMKAARLDREIAEALTVRH